MRKIVKKIGRALLQAFPSLGARRREIARRRLRATRALLHMKDAIHTYTYMKWESNVENYWKLSSELFFQYHKIEKGLCIPGAKRFFGVDPFFSIVDIIRRWHVFGYPTTDPVYLGAIGTLHAYRRRLESTPPPAETRVRIISEIDSLLAAAGSPPGVSTPLQHIEAPNGSFQVLQQLCQARRSVRSYSSRAVSVDDIHAAIEVAQLSPSACNRQPWKVHVYTVRQEIDAMLALQNGNAGFGHTIPMLMVITADSNGFFDGSERNQPFIDAGLFSMSLLLALQARNISSCCLNWCVTNVDTDLKAHEVGSIPMSEKIVMYLAVGYADNDALVPRSMRRNLDSFILMH